MRHARKLAAITACLASVLAFATPAQAADEALALRIRASQLAFEGHCDQALGLLARARELEADDAKSALLTGQCLVQARDYGEALPHLAEASRLDPESGDAALLHGMTAYRVGDLDAAQAALDRANTLMPNSAEVALYRGLVLLERADHDAAIQELDRARSVGPTSVEPMASYYAGLAHHQAGHTEEAKASLRRVSELAPGSEWARQAEAALAAPPSKVFELRQWLVLKAGVEYDSNPALIADGIVIPSSFSDDGDGRGVYAAEIGTELYRDENWGVGVMADYFATTYFDEHDFDQQFLGGSIFVDRKIDETMLLRVQPLVGFSWYDESHFLRFYGVRKELVKNWGDEGVGTFYARYSYDDYLYDIVALNQSQKRDRNRDGHNVMAGYDHRLSLSDSTTMTIGPYGRYYDSKGDDWDFWGLGFWLRFTQELPWDVTGELAGGYEYDHYEHPSSYLLPGEKRTDRRDQIGVLSAQLERPLFFDWLKGDVHYRYYNSKSNTDVFDYDRHIVGVLLTAEFGD